MLSKCSNPDCSARFRYLHTGQLFRFDARDRTQAESGKKLPRGVEFFWLCQDCAVKFTLVSNPVAGARVVSLQRRAIAAAASL
jgi:hypothetical protein